MIPTPIVIVEDRGLLALSISTLFRRHQEALRAYQLAGPIQIVGSNASLRDWLAGQPAASVGLLLLDYSVVGGESTSVLAELRDPASREPRSPALSPQALAIGWSAHPQAAADFRAAGADGFISKHRPVAQLVDDVLAVISRHAGRQSWTELL